MLTVKVPCTILVPRDWQNCCTDPSGRTMTTDEVKEWLMDQLERGHRVIPMELTACPEWDYQKGCPGHEEREVLDA